MRRPMSFLAVIALVVLVAWCTPRLRAQTKAPAKTPQRSAQATTVPPVNKKPAQAAPSAKQLTQAAPGAKRPAKVAAKPKRAQPAKARPAAAAQTPPAVARRDPFDPLVGRGRPGGELAERLPPGKPGLVVSTLRLDGLVRGPNGMIAVVSNPQQRVYFLREGDRLYDGRVEHITLEAVAFHESVKDAFGKPVDRQVIKRLYSSSGEQR